MQRHSVFGIRVIMTLSACLVMIASARTHIPSIKTFQKEGPMATHASGTFDVKIVQQPASEMETAAGLGRMTIDKQFHGELEGSSKGEMLTSGDVKASAAYVALERVTGTLNGRSGTFLLQHTASMTPNSQQMVVAVAPDSGTGQLVGLAGKFTIKIVDKKHFYEFEYSLPSEN